MRSVPSRTVVRLTSVATVAVVGALIALMLHAGKPGEPWWWGVAIPFGAWIVGPSIAPYLCARRHRSRRSFAWLMLAFLCLSSVCAASVYHNAFFVSESSTAALALLFVPLYQWAAFAVVVLAGALLIRRNAERD